MGTSTSGYFDGLRKIFSDDSVIVRRSRAFIFHETYPLCFLLLFGLLLRSFIMLGTDGIIWPDSLTYYGGAIRILENGIMAPQTIFRTPLYPAFLSIFLRFGETPAMGLVTVGFQHIFGLLSVLLAYKSTRIVFGPGVAFITAMLLNIHTLLLYYENVIHTEVLFVFLLNLAVYVFLKSLETEKLVMWIVLGISFGLLTLTRPIGQLLLPALLPVIWWKFGNLRKAILLCIVSISVCSLALTPCMLSNLNKYGFFGVVHIQGAQLFHKVFDKADLKPVENTGFPEVKKAMTEELASQDKRRVRVDWSTFYRLQHYGFTPLEADKNMFNFAKEAIWADPFRFARDTLQDFGLFFWSAQPSICVRQSSKTGPYLSSMYSKRYQTPAFPRKPVVRFPSVRKGIAEFFKHWALPVRGLVVFALAGVIMFFTKKRQCQAEGLSFLIVPLYLGFFTVIFETYEDRYRLPADPFIFAFAVFTVITITGKAVMWLSSVISSNAQS